MGAPQVLIVGGGLAGVSASAALRRAGCGVQLIEREARAGGRAAGREREGFRLDAAPFLVSSREQRLLDLIGAASLTERLLPLRPVALVHARGGRLDPAPPAGRRLEVARIGGVRLREALRLHRLARLERRFADLLDPEAPERAVRLDDRSAADFVRLYFGPSVLERWAEPILGSDLLADAAEASRAAFLLARRARGEAPPATLRGTPAAIADALLRDADALGVEARALERSGAELALDTSAGQRRADAVVLALPAAETLRVAAPALAPAEREGLAPLRSVAAIVMHVALDRAPTRKATRVRVPRVEGLPLATVAVEPGGRDAPAPAGAALVSLVATPGLERRASPGGRLRDREGAARSAGARASRRVRPRSASARSAAIRARSRTSTSAAIARWRGSAASRPSSAHRAGASTSRATTGWRRRSRVRSPPAFAPHASCAPTSDCLRS